MREGKFAAALVIALLLAGCTVGPKYQRPTVATPSAWKEQPPFRAAQPRDAANKGDWWQVFGDPDLDALEAEATKANQTVEIARNQLQQARALAQISQAALYPTLNVSPSAQRARISGNRPTNGSLLLLQPVTQNTYAVPFNINYEVDLFGGVRRSVEAANEQYQSSAANVANVLLTIQSELAADYFQMRELDAEIAVVNQGLDFQQKGLDLVERRHAGGIASGLDVAEQSTVLDQTRTQAQLLTQQRKQYEHAIATLVGKPASEFTYTPKPLQFQLPEVPLGIPSDVLERRPDIAQAERIVAAQNALIGVAESALYPSINLFGVGGLQSSAISKIASAPSFVWSLGAGAVEPLLNGGRIHAQIDLQKSAYGASIANYRQTVLTAFQQVEDGISGLSVLATAAQSQEAAVQDAQTALRIANDRYTGGITSYLDVITAQETLLTNRRLAAQILGQRLITSVYLVKALGGGWDAHSLDAIHVDPNWRQALRQ